MTYQDIDFEYIKKARSHLLKLIASDEPDKIPVEAIIEPLTELLFFFECLSDLVFKDSLKIHSLELKHLHD